MSDDYKKNSRLHYATYIVSKIKKGINMTDECLWKQLCYNIIVLLIYGEERVSYSNVTIYFEGNDVIRYESDSDNWQKVISHEMLCEALSYSGGSGELFNFITDNKISARIMKNEFTAISKAAVNGIIRSMYMISPADVTNPAWNKYTIQRLDKVSRYYFIAHNNQRRGTELNMCHWLIRSD